jgi:hypothetical protein
MEPAKSVVVTTSRFPEALIVAFESTVGEFFESGTLDEASLPAGGVVVVSCFGAVGVSPPAESDFGAVDGSVV